MTEKSKKPRRSRADSMASAMRDVRASGRVIEPPADMKLDKAERAIFAELIDELPKGEWTAHQARLAAILARDMRALAHEQELLRIEGTVLIAANGGEVSNPRQRAVNSLNSTILAMRRSLSLTARAKAGGDNRVLGQRRAIQKGNETMLDSIDDEGLLARPNVHILKRRKDH